MHSQKFAEPGKPSSWVCTGPLSGATALLCDWNEAKIESSKIPVKITQFMTIPGGTGVTIFSANRNKTDSRSVGGDNIVRVKIAGQCLITGNKMDDEANLASTWKVCLQICQYLTVLNARDEIQLKLSEEMKQLINDPSVPVRVWTRVSGDVQVEYELTYREYQEYGLNRACVIYNVNVFSPILGKLYRPVADEILW